MRVLSVASEVYPLVKTGGLADVAGALPPALGATGVDCRTLLPGYPAVLAKLGDAETVHSYEGGLLGARARILAAQVGALSVLVLDAPALYNRAGGPYVDTDGRDHGDNWRRFAALSRAGADIVGGLLSGWQPDLIHAHDWQAGLVPVYLKFGGNRLPSVMTIHNLAFQGQFGADIFWALGLPDEAFSVHGLEYYGDVGFLKGGLQTAWAITTVSPTYAEEIRTPQFGMGLGNLLASRAGGLTGIVNGIDTDVWNPATDPLLAATFSADALCARIGNRHATVEAFGIADGPGPLFSIVSRLTVQKGLDLMVAATGDLIAAGGRLAVLGTGDPRIEAAFRDLAAANPGRVGVRIEYDETLAHRLQGGADAIVVPSRFEPCGLTQLCGLRYGCVPVVSRTGGLADTVIDANHAALNAGVATGLHFASGDADALRAVLRRAVALYADRALWSGLQRQGMTSDVSWERSARAYADLYASLQGSA